MNNGDWERLKAVINRSGMSINGFAVHIGMSHGENIYRIQRGENGISRRLAERVAEAFPDISKGWLLSGEGMMLRTERAATVCIPYYDDDMQSVLADSANSMPTASLFRFSGRATSP